MSKLLERYEHFEPLDSQGMTFLMPRKGQPWAKQGSGKIGNGTGLKGILQNFGKKSFIYFSRVR
jgi:hypothetical protein